MTTGGARWSRPVKPCLARDHALIKTWTLKFPSCLKMGALIHGTGGQHQPQATEKQNPRVWPPGPRPGANVTGACTRPISPLPASQVRPMGQGGAGACPSVPPVSVHWSFLSRGHKHLFDSQIRRRPSDERPRRVRPGRLSPPPPSSASTFNTCTLTFMVSTLRDADIWLRNMS